MYFDIEDRELERWRRLEALESAVEDFFEQLSPRAREFLSDDPDYAVLSDMIRDTGREADFELVPSGALRALRAALERMRNPKT